MKDSGVYCLHLRLAKARSVRFGGEEHLLPHGHYFYTGSAMNALEARIGRHLSSRRKTHWHIDHLMAVAAIHRVHRLATGSRAAECRLAALLEREAGAVPVPGFGCSDCRCGSHLFHFESKPDFNPLSLLRPPDPEAAVRILKRLHPAAGSHERPDAFRTLVACIISLRTQDPVTDAASRRLFALASTPEGMADLPPGRIAQAIYPAGFYRQKGKTLRAIAEILLECHGGSVPATVEALVSLPGVGRKTANLVLGRAFGKPAICVDTHVHRISNRLGWVATDNPGETEVALQRVLPRRHWVSINALLVTHGQTFCHPTSPKCGACALARHCLRDGVVRHR
jgi:endonuclease-3